MARRTAVKIGYDNAIEDVLALMRSEFGFNENGKIYRSIKQLKDQEL